MGNYKTGKWRLRLYMAGDEEKMKKTALQIKQICNAHLEGQCEIEAIDVAENPQMAVQDNIIATPCLIRMEPGPVRRIIGDLTDRKELLKGLEIDEESGDAGL